MNVKLIKSFFMNLKTKDKIEKDAVEFADSMNMNRCTYWHGLRQGFISGCEAMHQQIDRMQIQMNALVREIEIYQSMHKC